MARRLFKRHIIDTSSESSEEMSSIYSSESSTSSSSNPGKTAPKPENLSA